MEAGATRGASPPLLVSSTKGGVGHMLGAAGAVEAVFTLLALRDRVAPPTLNLSDPLALPLGDGEGAAAASRAAVRLVGSGATPMRLDASVKAAMSNSFGFGGTNTSLLFATYDGDE